MPILVEGVTELKRALRNYAPDLKKQMDNEIKTALKEVITDARAHVPAVAPGGLYNWQNTSSQATARVGFPKYDSTLIRKGLTYSLGRSKFNNKGFAGLYSLLNKSAIGAIVETAGRKNPQGRIQIKKGQSNPSRQFGTSNNPKAGRQFVNAMNGVGALTAYDSNDRERGRLLYAAYARNNGKALNATMAAINKANMLFNLRAKAKKAA